MHRSTPLPPLLRPALALLLAVAPLGCKPPPSQAPEGATADPNTTGDDGKPLPSGVIAGLVTTTSTVQAVDQTTRIVTLTNADGTTVTFRAGDEVRNLEQVEVGDQVTVEYYESIAYQVLKAEAGAAATTVDEGGTVAALGDKPGADQVRVTTMTTTIVGIDKPAGTVSLQEPSGAVSVVKVRDPANLDRVAIGDLVDITLTEAVAISVSTPAE